MRRLHVEPLLRKRVASIEVVEGTTDAFVLPSTAVVLGIQFRGRIRSGTTLLSRAGVTGLQTSARSYAYERGAGSILVRFTPLGATCLGVPASELTNRNVPLADLLPAARVDELTERLAAAQDDHERGALVANLFAALPTAGDATVARALTLLDDATDDASIAAVARELGMSERQLERRFLTRVGLTPKRYASLRRFERAVARSATAPSLSVVALDAGYYDQSHFIREFRRFTGHSPKELLGTARR